MALSRLAAFSAAECETETSLAGETGETGRVPRLGPGVVPGRVGVEDELPNNCGENPIGKVFGTAGVEDCGALEFPTDAEARAVAEDLAAAVAREIPLP